MCTSFNNVSNKSISLFCLVSAIVIVFVIYYRFDQVSQGTIEKYYKIFGNRFNDCQQTFNNDTTQLCQHDDFIEQKRYFDKLSETRRNSISNENRLESLQMFVVPQISCPTAVRVGVIGDGGKWVCNPWRVKSPCVVYSFGVSGDTSFESNIYELTRKRCKIYSFDVGPQKDELFAPFQGVFKQWKISDQTDQSKSEWSIVDIAKYFSHEKVDFLKMDIESAEFAALPPLLNSNLVTNGKVCQILIEMHTQVNGYKSLQTLLEQRGFLMFYKEANMYCPKCYEYSYIHTSCLTMYGISDEVFNKNYS